MKKKMDMASFLNSALVGFFPIFIIGIAFAIVIGIVLAIKGGLFKGLRGTTVHPLLYPIVVYEKFQHWKNKRKTLLPILLAVVAGFPLILSVMVAQPVSAGMASYTFAPTSGDVSVKTGLPTSMDIGGLTASTTYKIYIGSEVAKVFRTGSTETTKTISIIFTGDGEFNVSLRDETGATYHSSLIMYAENAFYELLVMVYPLLFGAAAVLVIIGGIIGLIAVLKFK